MFIDRKNIVKIVLLPQNLYDPVVIKISMIVFKKLENTVQLIYQNPKKQSWRHYNDYCQDILQRYNNKTSTVLGIKSDTPLNTTE